MKVWTILVAACAAFALAAPATYASNGKRVAHDSSKVGLRATSPHKKAKKTGGVSPKIIIVAPGQNVPATASPATADCVAGGVNCTEQQSCQIWGLNCDQDSTLADPAAILSNNSAAPVPLKDVAFGGSTALNSSVGNSGKDCSYELC